MVGIILIKPNQGNLVQKFRPEKHTVCVCVACVLHAETCGEWSDPRKTRSDDRPQERDDKLAAFYFSREISVTQHMQKTSVTSVTTQK